ncbi:MAG: hypothetical protein ACRD2G_04705, partial [Terriglobia bacterium]
TVELLVFPQALQQIQSVLKPDAALLIKGRLRQEENARPKVVVSEAQLLESAVSRVKPEIVIKLDTIQASESMLEGIDRALAAHPGDNPVVFELTQPGEFKARLRTRRPPGVKPSDDLMAELQSVCGKGAVALVHPKPANGR